MKKSLFLIPILALGLLAGCSGKGSKSEGSSEWVEPDMSRNDEKIESDSLYVRQVKNMPDDFILGMDASSVIAEEQSGVKYYNQKGEEEDVFKILSDNGVNYIRVRIWNDPYDEKGHGYGGGNNDLAKAIEIGKRATKYKMRLLVNFHYSDFWADPAKQQVPKAWVGMDLTEKREALYQFTKDSLQQLKDNNIAVGMVQVGNETSGGKMAGETRFSYFAALFNEGSKAVREVYPNALVACHFANPEKSNNYYDWAKKMADNNVDYDVFGSSYYPWWHGTLENLGTVLDTIAKQYNKKVMVLETSYAYTTDDTDFWGNTIGTGNDFVKNYPISIAGQTNSVIDITDTVVNHMTNGIGICYWEGTWISVGTTSYDENFIKWEKYGSGWASSYAGSYDKTDAAKWYGGCAVENQAFFDEKGKALESLKVFNLMRYGNEAPKYIDGVEDAVITYQTDEDFTLPETVNVVYNDNSKEAIPVVWEEFDIPAAKAQGNGRHVIKGVAGGREVQCILTLLEYNYLQNYGFEDGKLDPWKLNNMGEPLSDVHKVQITAENPHSGSNAFHFWSKEANCVKFELEQDVTLEKSGQYKYQLSIMGGTTSSADPDKQNIYAYVKINDVIVKQQSGKVTKYGEWADIKISGIEYTLGDKITIGIHVECSEEGIWGDIDDAMFNYVEVV